jgi:hypothetical protein
MIGNMILLQIFGIDLLFFCIVGGSILLMAYKWHNRPKPPSAMLVVLAIILLQSCIVVERDGHKCKKIGKRLYDCNQIQPPKRKRGIEVKCEDKCDKVVAKNKMHKSLTTKDIKQGVKYLGACAIVGLALAGSNNIEL